MGYNEHMNQTQLIELITSQQRTQTLVVEAEAGSGKTWSVMAAIAQMPSTSKVFVAAPTHVAVNELRGKLWPKTVCSVTFGTTAKLAGRYLQMNRNTATLENKFTSASLPYDLVVVDELSAVPAVDLRRMLRTTTPLVLLGDKLQLGAVLSKKPDVWTADWANYENRSFAYVELEGQRRTSGLLYETVRRMRNEDVPLVESFEGLRVHYDLLSFQSDFISHLTKAYVSGDDLSQICYLAYRNSTVATVRQMIREALGSDNFVSRECVRVSSAQQWPTGTLLTVLDTCESQTIIAGHSVRTAKVLLAGKGQDAQWVVCVHPAEIANYNKLMENLKEEHNWNAFFELEQHFTVIENACAMTVHKSMGRTISYVWSDSKDIGTRNKLRYVANSRASKMLTAWWPHSEWRSATKKLLKGKPLAELHAMRQLTAW